MPYVVQVAFAGLILDAAFISAVSLIVVLLRRLAANRKASEEREEALRETIELLNHRVTALESGLLAFRNDMHQMVNSGALGPAPVPYYPMESDPARTWRSYER
jgi:hypothetical protein